MTPIRIISLVDVLVLRIENGKDYYVTISAEFGPTPLGHFSFDSTLY